MKRSAIQLAKKTLVVSLPAQWARKHNISKGCELNVSETEKGLLITASGEPPAKSITIDISKFDATLARYYVFSLYKNGYDEITILFNNPEIKDNIHKKNFRTLDLIAEIASSRIGMGILKQSKNSCTLKEISTPKKEEFDPALRRCFLSLINMAEEATGALCHNDAETAKNIVEHAESQINKLSDFCLRVLNKHLDSNECIILGQIISAVEEISDSYERLFRDIGDAPESTLKFLKQTNELTRIFYETTYSTTSENLVKLNKKRQELLESAAKEKGALPIEAMKSISKRIFETIGLKIAIDVSVHKNIQQATLC